MSLNGLPVEVLHEIVSYLSSAGLTDLRNCSLVSQALSAVATSVLYRNVDLIIDERHDEDTAAQRARQQLRMLRSISENPNLGACVRTFKSYQRDFPGASADPTLDPDRSMVITAAQNMKNLRRASFTPNPLSAYIIANLQSYPQLVDLTVRGLKPEEHIWSTAPVSLITLEWDVPGGPAGADIKPWDAVCFLVNVAATTCPGLQSLEVSLSQARNSAPILPVISDERAQQYREAQTLAAPKLAHLGHFGFRSDYWSDGAQSGINGVFLDFLTRDGGSSKSVSIPLSYRSWSGEMLELIVKVCGLVPDLKDLSLTQSNIGHAGGFMAAPDFLRSLTTKFASPAFAIEYFSMANIGCPFSPAIGKLFQSWTSLKFLQLGDKDNGNGPYDEDGRLSFVEYKSEILGFIKELPQSLEEVYLEINGEDLLCDEDEDFDPMCDLGTEIFTTLRRLHTCDIHACISNIDGGQGPIPEKAVFYRRLPHVDSESGGKIKDLWTSRMDCIYQESDTVVTKKCEELQLEQGKGDFEGGDAAEVWCDGFTSGEPGSASGDSSPRSSDSSLSLGEDKVASYPMFRWRFE